MRCYSGLEREISFVLERIGVLGANLLLSEPAGADLVAAWQNLDLGKTLKPFFAYDGDSRVSIRGLPLPGRRCERSRRNPGAKRRRGHARFIYRCAMHTRLDVWLQCEALSLLESLSATSLEKVLNRRLQNPAPDEGPLRPAAGS